MGHLEEVNSQTKKKNHLHFADEKYNSWYWYNTSLKISIVYLFNANNTYTIVYFL